MNNSYILLRSNKESASLSLDALLQLGLKPDDLIWVECQSVTWRHPHEIPELKGLAFETIPQAAPVVEKSVETVLPEEKPIEKKVEKKNVLEELLAEVRSVNQTEDIVPFEDLDVNGMYKYAGIEKKNSTDKRPPQQSSKTIPIPVPVDETIDFPQQTKKISKEPFSLDSIQLPVGLKKIAVYAGLILTGALLMFLINGSTKKETVASVQTIPAPVTSNIAEETTTEEYVTPVNMEQPTEMESLPQNAISTVAAPIPNENINSNKKPVEKISSNQKKDIVVQDVSEPVKPASEQTIETKPEPVENVSSKLSLKANDYGIGSFGGIKNLEVTLQNNSKYLLDKVTAEIRYLNPEGSVVLTDHINFQSVQPGETATLPVNKTKRGVKVSLKIIKIESKEINGSTAGL